MKPLQIISSHLLEAYSKKVSACNLEAYNFLKESELTISSFSF
jgi:hypothetical protein